MFEYDVCIIGTGRVGLPLGLSLTEVGVKATGVDVDDALIESINAGRMPFQEPGYDEVIATRKFRVQRDHSVTARARTVIITVGTPLHNHIETDLGQIQRVLGAIKEHLRPQQLIVLRSTVAPGTTEYVRKWLDRHTELTIGKDLFLAFCPERIAEGVARQELRDLPQIVGGADKRSKELATELFARLASEVLETDYITAELVKLFNNISRYIQFAVANQFALIADSFGANIFETRRLANYEYPRCDIARPGFTAGTCLRKDFGMINEWIPYPDILLAAWKMNEFTPAMLVENLMKRTSIHNKRVAVLGFSFKANTDDTRDSLVPKLYRYIQRQLPAELRLSDHNLPDPIPEPTLVEELRNWSIGDAIDGADCIFVAMGHDGYRQALWHVARTQPETWVTDIWNVSGIDKIFYQAKELLGAAEASDDETIPVTAPVVEVQP